MNFLEQIKQIHAATVAELADFKRSSAESSASIDTRLTALEDRLTSMVADRLDAIAIALGVEIPAAPKPIAKAPEKASPKASPKGPAKATPKPTAKSTPAAGTPAAVSPAGKKRKKPGPPKGWKKAAKKDPTPETKAAEKPRGTPGPKKGWKKAATAPSPAPATTEKLRKKPGPPKGWKKAAATATPAPRPAASTAQEEVSSELPASTLLSSAPAGDETQGGLPSLPPRERVNNEDYYKLYVDIREGRLSVPAALEKYKTMARWVWTDPEARAAFDKLYTERNPGAKLSPTPPTSTGLFGDEPDAET